MDDKKSKIISFVTRQPIDFKNKLTALREVAKFARKGGRCLDAIWERDDLTTGEKSVLCQIGAFHDYRVWTFTGEVQISVNRLMKRTSMSRSGIQKILRSLEGKGFLITVQCQKKGKRDERSKYRLSPRLFSDYGRVIEKEEVESSEEIIETPPESKKKKRSKRNVPGATELQKSEETPTGGPTECHETGKNNRNMRPLSEPIMEKNTHASDTEWAGRAHSVSGEGLLSEHLFPSSFPSTSFQEFKTPADTSRTSSRGAGSVKITLTELVGAMLGLYTRFTQESVIVSLIKALQRNGTDEEILAMIERETAKGEPVRAWSPSHKARWLLLLKTPQKSEPEPVTEPQEPVYETEYAPLPPDDFPF